MNSPAFDAFLQPKLWPLLILALILLLLYIAAFISHFPREAGDVFKFERWLQATILFVPVVFLWAIYGQSLGTHLSLSAVRPMPCHW